MSVANQVTVALVLDNLRFTSSDEIQGKGRLGPRASRPLTMVRISKAAEESPQQQLRRGAEPYPTRGGSSRAVRRARGGISSLSYRPEREIVVDAIFSAHSDGLMVILRKA